MSLSKAVPGIIYQHTCPALQLMFELLSLSPPLATLATPDWRAGLRGAGKKTRHLDFKLLRRLVWAGDCGLDVLSKLHQSVARQY